MENWVQVKKLAGLRPEGGPPLVLKVGNFVNSTLSSFKTVLVVW